ncbi:MAG: hypothetical protein O2970_11740 [Proteobacteria bacterium]|nr:hypothetical protein [Pseudomonadota bacterium]
MSKKNNISALRSLKKSAKLENVDIDALTKGADLQEQRDEKVQVSSLVEKKHFVKNLKMPMYLKEAATKMINEGGYSGNFTSYINEALRKQLKDDGYL